MPRSRLELCLSYVLKFLTHRRNITSSELAFRIAVDEPEIGRTAETDSYDYHAHEMTWGMAKGIQYVLHNVLAKSLTRITLPSDTSTRLNNVVGATETCEGRCIAFPNVYQHRVSPFKLAEPTEPGHRKILALFLVDPSISPIPSTTHVPPQQASWAMQALYATDADAPVHRLPKEILSMIENDSGLMNESEAKALRLDLMKERTSLMEGAEEVEYLFSGVFNLCEH